MASLLKDNAVTQRPYRGVVLGLAAAALFAGLAAKGQVEPSSEPATLECSGLERVALNGGEVQRHAFTGLLFKVNEARNLVEVSPSRDKPFASFCSDADSRRVKFSADKISVNCEYNNLSRSLTISRLNGVLADHVISYRNSLPVEKFMDAQCIKLSADSDADVVKRAF